MAAVIQYGILLFVKRYYYFARQAATWANEKKPGRGMKKTAKKRTGPLSSLDYDNKDKGTASDAAAAAESFVCKADSVAVVLLPAVSVFVTVVYWVKYLSL